MSLIPMLFSNWWEDLDQPHSISGQHFGLPLSRDPMIIPPSDFVSAEPHYTDVIRPTFRGSRHYSHPYNYGRRWPANRRAGGLSTVKADKDKFNVCLEVQQFAPEEITVKVVDRNVIIEGKHEEKQDEHGSITRHFVRKYLVPEQCDIEQLKSSLSSDGILTIEAPRKRDPKVKERVIQIQHTKKPALKDDELSTSSDLQNTQVGASQKSSKTVKAA